MDFDVEQIDLLSNQATVGCGLPGSEKWTHIHSSRKSSGKLDVYTVGVVEFLKAMHPSVESHVWKGQRHLDETRVEQMYLKQQDLLKSTGCYGYDASCLHLVRVGTKKPEVLDGQHRLHVFERLARFNPDELRASGLIFVVKVTNLTDEKDIPSLFREINDNWEPVPSAYLDADIKKVIESLEAAFRRQYDVDNFGESQRCHRPRLHLPSFLDKISSSKPINSYIRTRLEDSASPEIVAKELFKGFESYNSELGCKDYTEFCFKDSGDEMRKVLDAHKKIAKLRRPLYFGLLCGSGGNYTWLDKIEFGAFTEVLPASSKKAKITLRKK